MVLTSLNISILFLTVFLIRCRRYEENLLKNVILIYLKKNLESRARSS